MTTKQIRFYSIIAYMLLIAYFFAMTSCSSASWTKNAIEHTLRKAMSIHLFTLTEKADSY